MEWPELARECFAEAQRAAAAHPALDGDAVAAATLTLGGQAWPWRRGGTHLELGVDLEVGLDTLVRRQIPEPDAHDPALRRFLIASFALQLCRMASELPGAERWEAALEVLRSSDAGTAAGLDAEGERAVTGLLLGFDGKTAAELVGPRATVCTACREQAPERAGLCAACDTADGTCEKCGTTVRALDLHSGSWCHDCYAEIWDAGFSSSSDRAHADDDSGE